jgi:hypothetical protein
MLITPNPARENITLHFELKKSGNTSVELVDNNGQLITKLMTEKTMMAGKHKALFNLPANLAAGIYFVHINSGSINMAQKIIVQ